MMRALVRCFIMPSRLKNENIYRVRKFDGSCIEGYVDQRYITPTHDSHLGDPSSKKSLLFVWGMVETRIIHEQDGKASVIFPDNQTTEIKSNRVLLRLPQETVNAQQS